MLIYSDLIDLLETIESMDISVANLSDAMDYLSIYDQVIVGLENYSSIDTRFSGIATTIRWVKQRKDRDILRPAESTWDSVRDFVKPYLHPNTRNVYVAGAGEFVKREALLGGLSAYYLTETLGCEALVLGGAVRDYDDLDGLNKPILATNYSPIDTQGSYLADASSGYCRIDNVQIFNGDLIVGDRSGVAVLPCDRAIDIVSKARDLRKSETATRNRLLAGDSLPDLIDAIGHI